VPHLTKPACAHFIEHDDVKESDSDGTLPDHEDLVDHHQMLQHPTVALGELCEFSLASTRLTTAR